MNKRHVRFVGILLIVLILSCGCIRRPTSVPTPTATPTATPVPTPTPPAPVEGGLSHVRVATLYERVTDGTLIGRDVNEVITLFKDTKTDFIFRGWWIWQPCANRCSEVPPGITYAYDCELMGYSYEHLQDALSKIKREMPDVIFCGAIPAQRVNYIEINPMSGKIYSQSEVERMAIDPAHWGITSVSKEEAQKYFQERGTGAGGYYPDITNPEYQELLLSWAQKQIDCGADAIWIDGLFGQARMFETVTKDQNHPAVKASFEAASKIIDEIHNYGNSKYGKYIYVGTWGTYFPTLPYTMPNLDFVTLSPSINEISQKKLDEREWETTVGLIREKLGEKRVFVFIDWAGDESPMVTFSQQLSPAEQEEFLKRIDSFCRSNGLVFVYPLHGGFMGSKGTRLSGGKFRIYDSLAQEFQTYETIKELAQNKSTK
ncbi:MAG: hypothetical protein EFT35_02785 [Methanophagales archaeon ANME-1-THS]|nr:MAG: hypothetical protein EFT35_02785 [Methanophagales archaeon ANME-1-THS]